MCYVTSYHIISKKATKRAFAHDYSEQDAMLVLKDILAHKYMDNRKKGK